MKKDQDQHLSHEQVFAEEQFEHTTQLAVGVCPRGMSLIEGIWILAHEYLGFLLEQLRESKIDKDCVSRSGEIHANHMARLTWSTLALGRSAAWCASHPRSGKHLLNRRFAACSHLTGRPQHWGWPTPSQNTYFGARIRIFSATISTNNTSPGCHFRKSNFPLRQDLTVTTLF